MSQKALVLDANILIRAVLGQRVRALLLTHAHAVRFFAPDVAFHDAQHYLPGLLHKRGVAVEPVMHVLTRLADVVQLIEAEFYEGMRQQALLRIAQRDADDWPVLACALTLACPIWTEDTDFFGTGVATWTTDRISLYLP